MATATSGAPHDLRGGSIGVADVLFQAITYMAPGVGLAFSIGIAVPISGATLPLSVVVALIACTFAAIAIGQLARHIPSAGGLYTYAAKGIGPRSGFLIGWFYLGFALTLPSSLGLLGGWFMNSFLSGKGFDVAWWIWAALLMGSMFLLTFFDVRMSAKATIILGVIELAVLFALAVTMVASEPNSTIPFTPSEGANGWSGIFQGAVFAILAFIGFEAASALGEEAKNPRRTVQIGVIGSCVLVGLFYVFQTYAWNIGAKLDIVQHKIDSGNSDWTAFGEEYWGNIGGWILFLALVNSVIACGTAATNNAARVLFSMGRAGALPSVFGRTHPKYKSPYVGVISIVVFGYILDLIINQIYGDPLTGFFLSATFFTVLAILIYILSCTACIGFFNRKPEGRPHRNVLLCTRRAGDRNPGVHPAALHAVLQPERVVLRFHVLPVGLQERGWQQHLLVQHEPGIVGCHVRAGVHDPRHHRRLHSQGGQAVGADERGSRLRWRGRRRGRSRALDVDLTLSDPHPSTAEGLAETRPSVVLQENG